MSATKWILIYDYIFIVFFADLMYSKKKEINRRDAQRNNDCL